MHVLCVSAPVLLCTAAGSPCGRPHSSWRREHPWCALLPDRGWQGDACSQLRRRPLLLGVQCTTVVLGCNDATFARPQPPPALRGLPAGHSAQPRPGCGGQECGQRVLLGVGHAEGSGLWHHKGMVQVWISFCMVTSLNDRPNQITRGERGEPPPTVQRGQSAWTGIVLPWPGCL